MGSIWAANKPFWMSEAECREADPNAFTPSVESVEGLESVRSGFCNQCPVRIECLNSALIRNDSGYWGGTSSSERRSMRRKRSRSKCPLCQSNNLVRVDHSDGVWYEVCVNCAASWQADDRPTPRQKSARVRRPGDAPVTTVLLQEEAAECL
jgi:WhiB family redox-sensing transcriptional regulator